MGIELEFAMEQVIVYAKAFGPITIVLALFRLIVLGNFSFHMEDDSSELAQPGDWSKWLSLPVRRLHAHEVL